MYTAKRPRSKTNKVQRQSFLRDTNTPTVETEDQISTISEEIPAFNKHGLVNPQNLNSASILQLQKTLGNKSVSRLLDTSNPGRVSSANNSTIQRRTNSLPKADDMLAQASKDWFGSGTYEEIVEAVRGYYEANKNNYGLQMAWLENIINGIKKWEGEYGPVTQAIKPGFLGITSKHDDRRTVLKNLKGKLSAEETSLKEDGHKAADKDHKDDRDKLLEYVTEGLTSKDRRLRNSCEWMLVAKKSLLYAITPTGDAFQRLRKNGKDPKTDQAFFPEGSGADVGHIAKPAVTYNQNDLTDNTNVSLFAGGRTTGGWNAPGYVAIVSPSKSTKEEVWETLRHEVQHDSDKNKGRDSSEGLHQAGKAFAITGESMAGLGMNRGTGEIDPSKLPADEDAKAALLAAGAEIKFRRYRTEYRAYSYEEGDTVGKYAKLDNSKQDQTYDGVKFSTRQLAIFKHIYGGYPHTKLGWDKNPKLSNGKTFREAVSEYWNPDTQGFNKYNSVRVDDFYRALDAIGTFDTTTDVENAVGITANQVTGKISDANDPKVKTLLRTAKKLTTEDASYILNESPDMLRKIGKHLDGAALKAVKDLLTELSTATDEALDFSSIFD